MAKKMTKEVFNMQMLLLNYTITPDINSFIVHEVTTYSKGNMALVIHESPNNYLDIIVKEKWFNKNFKEPNYDTLLKKVLAKGVPIWEESDIEGNITNNSIKMAGKDATSFIRDDIVDAMSMWP